MQETQVWSLVQEDSHKPRKKLSLCTRTTEPVLQSPGTVATETSGPESPCSATRVATAVRSPSTANGRGVPAAMKTQHS